MMNKVAIRAEKLSKQYRVGAGLGRHNTLRDLITEGLKSAFRRNGRHAPRPGEFWALKDVDFEVNEGEILGIIGHNGAGKSTLLKILSRVTEPTEGRVEMNGRVGSLLEVGTGFHWELSGRENIYLSGAIMGMRKSEIDRKFDEIVSFAEIEKFLDMPVKRYSSGMYVRLAFSVAAHLEPEILLLDEVLAVGDLEFQRKCMAYAQNLKEKHSTILFVSHSMFAIKSMCTRVICLAHGSIQFDGSTEDGIRFYEDNIRLSKLNFTGMGTNVGSETPQEPIRITGCDILDADGLPCTLFNHGQRMRVRLTFCADQTLEGLNFIIAFIRSDNVQCCNFNTAMDGLHIPTLTGEGMVELLTPPLKLVSEMYTLHVLVRDESFNGMHCSLIGGTFHVRHPLLSTHFGVFHETAEWSYRVGESNICGASQVQEAYKYD